VDRFLQTLTPTIAVAKAYAKRVGLDSDWDNPSQKVIAETNGLSKAADLLERAFGLAQEDQQSQNRRSAIRMEFSE